MRETLDAPSTGEAHARIRSRSQQMKAPWTDPTLRELLWWGPGGCAQSVQQALSARSGGGLAAAWGLFRDKLRCRNALFLDGGTATSFYSPVWGRNSNFLSLGPIVGVYRPD